jgi:hypothetical protein
VIIAIPEIYPYDIYVLSAPNAPNPGLMNLILLTELLFFKIPPSIILIAV